MWVITNRQTVLIGSAVRLGLSRLMMYYLFVGFTTCKELGYKHLKFFSPESLFFLASQVQEDWGSAAASSERTNRVILRS